MAAPVGIGLRAPHYAEIATRRPALGFLEVHSENYFGAGGAPLAWLERLRADYPVSLHGVGLSLGSADPLDERHLGKLAALAARIEPLMVSEHLAWCSVDGRFANELLPLPFTAEAVAHVAARIGRVQDRLHRALLVENVSRYASFPQSTMTEAEFVSEVARRSGCRLLLDVNNIHVNAVNHAEDPRAWLDAIAPACVDEIHLAGYSESGGMLIDTHGTAVSPEVWALYREAIARIGPRPTLVEWDTDIPALDVLLGQARLAREVLEQHGERDSVAAVA